MGAAPSQEGSTPPSLAPHDHVAEPKDQEPRKPNSAAPTAAAGAAKKPDALPLPEVAKAKEAAAKALSALAKELTKEPAKKVPHMYDAIVRQADDAAAGDLLGRVRAGIFLNNKKKKYWVEEKTGYNCFMLFARDLLITWSEDQKYWQWVCLKETSDMEIEAASLLNVCWLEIHGRFDTSLLSPGATYDVSFVVMMELGYGWATPVNLRLTLPDGSVQQRKESLLDRPKGQWMELKAGEFTARKDQAGQMEFSLYEYEGGQWKRGLIVKGVTIRPKK